MDSAESTSIPGHAAQVVVGGGIGDQGDVRSGPDAHGDGLGAQDVADDAHG